MLSLIFLLVNLSKIMTRRKIGKDKKVPVPHRQLMKHEIAFPLVSQTGLLPQMVQSLLRLVSPLLQLLFMTHMLISLINPINLYSLLILINILLEGLIISKSNIDTTCFILNLIVQSILIPSKLLLNIYFPLIFIGFMKILIRTFHTIPF